MQALMIPNIPVQKYNISERGKLTNKKIIIDRVMELMKSHNLNLKDLDETYNSEENIKDAWNKGYILGYETGYQKGLQNNEKYTLCINDIMNHITNIKAQIKSDCFNQISTSIENLKKEQKLQQTINYPSEEYIDFQPLSQPEEIQDSDLDEKKNFNLDNIESKESEQEPENEYETEKYYTLPLSKKYKSMIDVNYNPKQYKHDQYGFANLSTNKINDMNFIESKRIFTNIKNNMIKLVGKKFINTNIYGEYEYYKDQFDRIIITTKKAFQHFMSSKDIVRGHSNKLCHNKCVMSNGKFCNKEGLSCTKFHLAPINNEEVQFCPIHHKIDYNNKDHKPCPYGMHCDYIHIQQCRDDEAGKQCTNAKFCTFLHRNYPEFNFFNYTVSS